MLASYKLLKNYIDFDYGVEELAEKLTMQGLEVEEVTEYGNFDEGIVVVEIREIMKHPNADRLSICKVSDGSKGLEVICGARNMKWGDKVCLASVGSSLPGGFKIKRATIRGVKSFGMLCSKSELGLGDESDGIWILPENAVLGDSINNYTSLDYILDISLTANRGDCLSLIGIARELRAICAKPLEYPKSDISIDSSIKKADIVVEESFLCKRYMARIIEGVVIKESPFWLKEAIIKMGARPINNVVDITNFVLFEMGHPLHAFDLDKLEGDKVFVRKAREGEAFCGIDGKERELSSSILVIADSSKAVALAGVMGGESSAVSEGTTSILLESAYFDASCVRRTSKSLDLSTESSYRFERGVDIDNISRALDRSAFLIRELACGEVSDLTDIYPDRHKPKEIALRLSFVNGSLGTDLRAYEIRRFLELLGFIVREYESENGILYCTIPSFRQDVEREIDIVEEIARVYSYNNIEEVLPYIKPATGKTSFFEDETNLKSILVGLGLTETISYSFSSHNNFNIARDSSLVSVLNPLTRESEHLRTNLLTSLLSAASYNVKHSIDSVSIFELGNVFSINDGEYIEKKKLGLLLYGFAELKGLYGDEREFDFFDLRGIVDALFLKLGKCGISFSRGEVPVFLSPYKSAIISFGNKELGFIGECHPSVNSELKLGHPIIFCELDFALLFGDEISEKRYNSISRFPFVLRDLAILVDLGLDSELVTKSVKNASSFLKEVVLLDIYTGEQIPSGKKSLAFALYFQSETSTLSDAFVNREYDNIVSVLGEQYSGKMRSI